MSESAKSKIEAFGWLCEDSLGLAEAADRAGDAAEAAAYRECARLWSDRAFKEAQS